MKKQIKHLGSIALLTFAMTVFTACNNEKCNHENMDELLVELQKYKDEEARVKKNLSFMTQADVSMNARDWDAFNEVHTHDVWVSTPDMPTPTENKKDHLAVVQSFVNAFPDHKIEQPYVYLFGQGDYICAVHQNGGTFTEPWILPGSGATAQPNGKKYTMKMATIATVKGDTISSEMIIYDMSDMMRQLEIDGSVFKMPEN